MEQELLPRVREGTYDSTAESIIGDYDTDIDFVVNYLTHLKEVNPQIALFIINWTNKLKGKRLAHSLIGLCTLYKMLESEADARQLEKEIGESNVD